MKFKVGDKVRILDGSKIPNYVGSWVSHSMRGYVGDIDTVREVHTGYNGSLEYYLNHHGFVWDERGLERVKSISRITITQDGELVTAKDEATGTGVTVNFDDEHKDFISASLYAHKKLIKEIRKNQPPVEEPKLYSHKVVCVKADGYLTDHAIVGKIYEFVNGNCNNEIGSRFLAHPVRSIEELNNCFDMRNLRFIELKED